MTTTVWAVLLGTDYEGTELDSIWSSYELARDRAELKSKSCDYTETVEHIIDCPEEG